MQILLFLLLFLLLVGLKPRLRTFLRKCCGTDFVLPEAERPTSACEQIHAMHRYCSQTSVIRSFSGPLGLPTAGK